jgi:cob(I)alamin adenosyltransferase
MMPLEKGLVQVYTGDGKGKTTAALGLALRAAGHGLRVHIVQFMKGWMESGEQQAVAYLPTVTLARFGRRGFVHPKHPRPEDFAQARLALEEGRRAMHSGEVDILILDEAITALSFGLLSLDDILGLLDERPPHMELVLTGRDAPEELCRRADLVTEMCARKHPFEQGIEARRGIEY